MSVKIVRSSYTLTRPADTTAYTAGDLVADNVTAGSVTPIRINIGRLGTKLVGLKLQKSNNTITNATFSIHLFGTSPTVANGDNGAISYTISDRIAILAFPIMTAGTDVGQTFLNQGDSGFTSPLSIADPDGIIYGLLEAKGAYTPVSAETFTLTTTYEKYI